MFSRQNIVQAVSIVVGVVLGVLVMFHLPFDPPFSSYRVHESWLSLSSILKGAHVMGWYLLVERILVTILLLTLTTYSAYVCTHFLVSTWAGVPVNTIRIRLRYYDWADNNLEALFTIGILVIFIAMSWAWLLFATGLGYYGLVVLGKRMSCRWAPKVEEEG